MNINIEETIKIMLKGVDSHTAREEIAEKLKKIKEEDRPLIIKLGLDPSAPDVHIGHAVVLRKMKQLQDLGHQIVIIIGDYTGMIGDPTGKSKTRKQLTEEEIQQNALTYQEQIFKILDKEKTIVRRNSEWLGKLTFKDVIELSSKWTVAKMLERDDFNKRYTNNQSISVHEFFYPLMQAYDSVAIKADIELGGTDQTYNILMGRDIQKAYGQEAQLTLFMPLLEGTDGVDKMSKSLGNYIGINEEANTIYEKVMKVPDNLIIKYYELCTDIHPDEIEKIKQELNNGANPRDIKMNLAKEITKLYHNEELAQNAEEHFKSAYQKQVAPDDVEEIEITSSDVVNELIEKILAKGKFSSKGEIKRLFSQGAVKIDGEKITDFKEISLQNNTSIVQIGKGTFYKIIKM